MLNSTVHSGEIVHWLPLVCCPQMCDECQTCTACSCAVHLLASLALGALAITVKRMAFILNAEVQNLRVFLTHDYCWVHQACGFEGSLELYTMVVFECIYLSCGFCFQSFLWFYILLWIMIAFCHFVIFVVGSQIKVMQVIMNDDLRNQIKSINSDGNFQSGSVNGRVAVLPGN